MASTRRGDWFKEQGFADVTVDDLPAPRKAMYNYQRNSAVMAKSLKKTA